MFRKGKKVPKDKSKDVGFVQLTLWQTRAISSAVAVLVGTYLMLYATDTLHLPAALVSTMLLASKILDSFTDLFAGIIVDRTNTRWGKGRPYEIFIIGTWFFTWLMFAVPESLSTTVKLIWILVSYSMVNAISVTILNANGIAYMVRAFKHQEQYVKITSLGTVYSLLFAVVFNIVFPGLVAQFGTSAGGWRFLIACVAIPMTIIGLMRMIFIPEVHQVESSNNTNKVVMKDIWEVAKQNKNLLYVTIASVAASIASNMGASVYYFKYVVGNLALQGVLGFVHILVIPAAFFLPKLISKLSVGVLIKWSFLLTSIGWLINFFAGSSMPLLMAGAIVSGLGSVPSSMLIGLIFVDLADYNEYMGYQRLEGSMASVRGFAGKVGASLGAGILGLLLQVSGYTGVEATMPDSAMFMIRLLYSVIPMALYLIAFIAYNFYTLDKQMPEIRETLAVRRQNLTENAE